MQLRETLGKAVRPMLESEALDSVRFVRPVRSFVRDWAVAFGLWDDGLLEREEVLGPLSAKDAAARNRAERQSRLTLYVDPAEATTIRIRGFLADLGAQYTEVDISDDSASRKWLAEEYDGARPPQVFIEGQRLGGLEDLQKMDQRGELRRRIFPQEESTHVG